MKRFVSWCRTRFTPRHKRIAQEAIHTANEAIAKCGQALNTIHEAIESLNRLGAELDRERNLLRAYRDAAMDPEDQLEALERMAGKSAEEAC